MTQQAADPFYWNREKFSLIEAEDIYSLFDPDKYGFKPKAPHTACWKGFIVFLAVRQERLYFESLWINCEGDNYPTINGVEAVDEGNFHIYEKIRLPLDYTGRITIGKDSVKELEGGAFIGRFALRDIRKLSFKNGLLQNWEQEEWWHGWPREEEENLAGLPKHPVTSDCR